MKKEKKEEKELKITKLLECPVAQVHISLGSTINVGNYESFKITCGLTLPCDTDDKSIKETIKKVDKIVNEMLKKEMDRVK